VDNYNAAQMEYSGEVSSVVFPGKTYEEIKRSNLMG